MGGAKNHKNRGWPVKYRHPRYRQAIKAAQGDHREPKAPQRDHREPNVTPKEPKKLPKTAQRAPKVGPKVQFGVFWGEKMAPARDDNQEIGLDPI